MPSFAVRLLFLSAAMTFPNLALAQNAAPPHVPLQKTIGAPKPQVVPSLIVLNSKGATLQSGKLVLTGIANWKTLNNAAPVANALKALGYDSIRKWVDFGALVGMISSLLVFQYGQARVWFAMSRDRLLPDTFSKVHPRFQTPHISTIAAGIVAGLWLVGLVSEWPLRHAARQPSPQA